jgi:tetratricopeptide (TPR) repeat protein
MSELLHQTQDAVARYPASTDLWTHRANALVETGHFTDALKLTSNLLRALPKSPKISLLRARAFSALGDDAPAKSLLEEVLDSEPDNLDVLIELGNICQRTSDPEAANRYYRKCLVLDPNCSLAKWNLAHILLSRKQFHEGWEFARFRWGTKGFKNLQTAFKQTEWDGVAHDKPIFILGEQGLGDQLLYAGMAVEVLRRFPHSFLFLNKKIVCLFNAGDLIGRVKAIEELDLSSDFYYRYAADLGALTRQNESNFPTYATAPFWVSSCDPVIDQFISNHKKIGQKKIIGLSWSSANPSLGDTKSPPLSEIVRLVSSINATFVNIQYGDHQDAINDIRHVSGKSIQTVPGLDTFADMARLAILISQLDLVITISNTTAHLSGSLCVPTILMMPPKGKASFWYWHTRSNSSRSLWYPSVEVIGHDVAAGWVGTIERAIFAVSAQPTAGTH